MSQSIDIYLTYCAMKAHFGKGDYDFVKFNGKTKVSRDSFWKRKDRVWFVMLGRKLNSYLIQSVEDYLLANFIVETKGYIGNFNDQNYFDWKDRMSRLETLFKNEATKLFEDGSLDVLKVPDNSHPKLLKEYLGKRVSAETMVILDKIMDYSSKWDTQMEDDMIWPKVKILLNNYKKLLTFDKKECKMILINLTNME